MLEKLDDIRTTLESQGYGRGTEQYGICCHAMSYLGLPYLRTEELSGATIDCSTLTSQSYWEGALIGIPFVAEGQRLANSAIAIDDVRNAEPGDVFVRYESVQHAPDRTYNHVGLFLGSDRQGNEWVIEARGDRGVILTAAAEFPPQGGIKRFTISKTNQFSGLDFERSLNAAKRVPKLGRLGARQYLSDGSKRLPHKGLDIYVEPGTTVLAPVSGTVRVIECPVEDAIGIEIVSADDPLFLVRMFHLNSCIDAYACVTGGEPVGKVVPPKSTTVSYVNGLSTGQTHLHIEAQYATSEFRELKSFTNIDGAFFFNPLYLAKLGVMRSSIE